MKTTLSFCLIAILFTFCGPDQKAIQKARFDEVMAVHDEVMPKMGMIRKLKGALQASADSLITADSLSAEAQEFLGAVAELEAANESMMGWMRSFAQPEEGTVHEEVLKFYEGEMEKVKAVREKMIGAIEKAEGMK